MNRLVSLTLALALTAGVLTAALGAQAPKYVWSPTGSAMNTGASNNTVPFFSTSATYQQVLDANDFTSSVVQMKGLAMRAFGTRTLTGRSWDLRITLSHTKVTAATASSERTPTSRLATCSIGMICTATAARTPAITIRGNVVFTMYQTLPR